MQKVQILLADDHALVRAGIRKTIEQMPEMDIVGETSNGPEVLAALEKNHADLLLIDVTMPDFEPISAIQKIRATYPLLKILVVSAYDDDVYVKGLLNAGVNGYHLKDQPLNDLKLAIKRVLEGERWISSSLIDKLVERHDEEKTPPALTDRQHTLLRLLQEGKDNKTIAQEIGLSIKTVENHLTRLYRKLDVQSRLEAVNFVIRFPQVLGMPGKQAAKTEAFAEGDLQRNVAILVVDDNARYRKQLLRMIGKSYSKAVIYEAKNTQDALQLVHQVAIQLALVDVVLGDENGIVCAQRIRSAQPNTRIVLISAYPDREFHRQGLESGAVAFLDKKNLDLQTLNQVIHDVVC